MARVWCLAFAADENADARDVEREVATGLKKMPMPAADVKLMAHAIVSQIGDYGVYLFEWKADMKMVVVKTARAEDRAEPSTMKVDGKDKVVVECGTLRGVFCARRSGNSTTYLVTTEDGRELTPTQFEVQAGFVKYKKWRQSIRVIESGVRIGAWLSDLEKESRA